MSYRTWKQCLVSAEGEENMVIPRRRRLSRRRSRLQILRKRLNYLHCRGQRNYTEDCDPAEMNPKHDDWFTRNLSLLSLDELALGRIVSFLDTESIYNLSLTCRRIYGIASDPHNWANSVLFSNLTYRLRSVLCLSESDQEMYSLHEVIAKAKDLKIKLSTMTSSNIFTIRELHGPTITDFFLITSHCSQRTEFDPVCIIIQPHADLTIQFNYQIRTSPTTRIPNMNKESVSAYTVKDRGFSPTLVSPEEVLELLRERFKAKPELTWEALTDILETIFYIWHSQPEHLKMTDEKLNPSNENGLIFEKENESRAVVDTEITKEIRQIRKVSIETFTETVVSKHNGQQAKAVTRDFIRFLVNFLPKLTVKHLQQLETVVINFDSTLNAICRLQPIVRICSHPLLKANLRAAVELVLRPMALKFATIIKADFWLPDNFETHLNKRGVTLELYSKKVLIVTGYPNDDEIFMTFVLPGGELISLSSAEITSFNTGGLKKLKPVTTLLRMQFKKDFKRMNLPKLSDSFVLYFFVAMLNMRQKGISSYDLNYAVDKFLRTFQKQELPKMGDAKKYRYT